jgi:hypothetical protein
MKRESHHHFMIQCARCVIITNSNAMGFESALSREARGNLIHILDDEVRNKLAIELSVLTRDLAAKLGTKHEKHDQRICLGDYGFHGADYERLTKAIEASEEYKALAHEAKLLGREIWVSAEADDNPAHVIHSEHIGPMDDPNSNAHATHARVWIEF